MRPQHSLDRLKNAGKPWKEVTPHTVCVSLPNLKSERTFCCLASLKSYSDYPQCPFKREPIYRTHDRTNQPTYGRMNNHTDEGTKERTRRFKTPELIKQDTMSAFNYVKDSGNFGRKSNGKVRFGFFWPEYSCGPHISVAIRRSIFDKPVLCPNQGIR